MHPVNSHRTIRIPAGTVTAEGVLNGSSTAGLIWSALPIEAKGETGSMPSRRSPNEIRPYSPVNVIGKVGGHATVFKKVCSGTKVRLERA